MALVTGGGCGHSMTHKVWCAQASLAKIPQFLLALGHQCDVTACL